MAKSKGNRIGLWIIMGLLFVGLIGFGSAGLNGGVRNIGTVGDKDIPVRSYDLAVREQLASISQNFGFQLSFQQALDFGVPQGVLAQLVADRALDNETDRLGVSVGDARILETITRATQFQNLSGEFDREAYRFQLQSRGQTEEEFETEQRELIARRLLQASVVGGLPAQDTFADAMVAFRGERRSFTWATLDAEALGSDVPDPTEDDVATFYGANPEVFTTPETRQISYAWITPELLQSQVEVDDEEVRGLYDERIDEFVQEERRLTERLVYPDQAEVDAALARVADEGATFDDLVSDRGLDLGDVDMGDVTRDDLGDAADAVFSAETGDIVGPFDTEFGPALFRVNAVLGAQETPFEDVEDDLREELGIARARRLIGGMEDQIADLLAGAASIEDLAERTDLVAGEIAWNDTVTEGIAAYDAFRTAAATASEGDFPELVELSDGGLFVLRLDGITDPTLRPLEDVQDQAFDLAKAAAVQGAVVAQTAVLVTQLATGSTFEDLGLTPETQENLIRRDFVAGTPENFMGLVFDMAEGDINTVEVESGTLIVRLDAINDVNLMDPAMVAEQSSIAEQVTNGIAEDIYGIFSAQVQSRTDVDIDQNAVNLVNSQFR